MDILIVEDEFLLGLMVADALMDVGHRVMGPASCRAEALALVGSKLPDLAFVDIELRGGDSGIEVAAELGRRGVRCVFATGQPATARSHREVALGLLRKPYNPVTILEVARYFEARLSGEISAQAPRCLELFGSEPTAAGTPPAEPIGANADALTRPSAAAAAGPRPATDQTPGDAGILAALAV